MRIDASGDADDLGPALAIALGKLNLAVVDATTDGDTTLYQLVDVLDRPALRDADEKVSSCRSGLSHGATI